MFGAKIADGDMQTKKFNLHKDNGTCKRPLKSKDYSCTICHTQFTRIHEYRRHVEQKLCTKHLINDEGEDDGSSKESDEQND